MCHERTTLGVSHLACPTVPLARSQEDSVKAQKTIQIAGLYFLGFDTFHVGPRASPLELQVPPRRLPGRLPGVVAAPGAARAAPCNARTARAAGCSLLPARACTLLRWSSSCGLGLKARPACTVVEALRVRGCRSPVRRVSVFALSGTTHFTQTCTAHTAHPFGSVPSVWRHAVCQTLSDCMAGIRQAGPWRTLNRSACAPRAAGQPGVGAVQAADGHGAA